MSKRNRENFEPSLDSFLDIVTNLVGILIILIMVISISARDAVVQAAADRLQEKEADLSEPTPTPVPISVPAPAPAPVEIAQVLPTVSEAELLNQQMHIAQIEAQAKQVNQLLASRFEERNQLQLILSSTQNAIKEKSKLLGDDEQKKFASQQAFIEKSQKVDHLYETLESLEEYEPETIQLKHYPTPMAETVFGNEEHFRLLNGRITYVPMNRLVEMLKNDARRKVNQLGSNSSITATVGPVGDFYCRYTLRRSQYIVDTSLGDAKRESIELDNFVLVPVSDNIGEPLEQAMQSGSQFSAFLTEFDPSRTTVTVWTYPDSFKEFRQLKDILYQKGFATAGRPLPQDFPIGGSPRGQRSSSQ
ncbi:MAG: hypothetical protein COA78_17945 [Blastopirellula sp.]|nr:MAG: hypothetical protein COA78_17945 [Blastopirellula sp.]